MLITPSIASLLNLAGPDLIVVLFTLLVVIGIPVAVVVILVRVFNRKGQTGGAGTVEGRLRKLDELKAKGTITNDEYISQRQRIISQV